MLACWRNRQPIVELLLRSGADPMRANNVHTKFKTVISSFISCYEPWVSKMCKGRKICMGPSPWLESSNHAWLSALSESSSAYICWWRFHGSGFFLRFGQCSWKFCICNTGRIVNRWLGSGFCPKEAELMFRLDRPADLPTLVYISPMWLITCKALTEIGLQWIEN